MRKIESFSIYRVDFHNSSLKKSQKEKHFTLIQKSTWIFCVSFANKTFLSYVSFKFIQRSSAEFFTNRPKYVCSN